MNEHTEEIEQPELLEGGSIPRKTAGRRIAAGLILVGLGIVALFILATIEDRWASGLPWHNAIRTLDVTIEDEDAIPVWSWPLTPEQSVGDSGLVQAVQADLMRMIALESRDPERLREESPVVAISSGEMLNEALIPRARIVMFDRGPEIFADVLASGRLPESGSRELLAGPLVSDRPLEINGETYTVVGRLTPHCSGFLKAFVMPQDPVLRTALDAFANSSQGSVHLDGAARIETLVPGIGAENKDERPVVAGGSLLTRTDIAWGVWFALLLVAAGATVSLVSTLHLLATYPCGFLNILFRETVTRSRLLWILNLVLFGGFFGAMAMGIQDAEMNYFFTQFASFQFEEGGLKYVGEAYDSGNMARAAHATFWNNFTNQTFLWGTMPSLLVPGFGVFKFLASFVVVGFVMAPVWAGTASGMTYHAITLGLELPPYVLACFGMAVWAFAVLNLIWSPVRVFYLGDKAKGVPVVEEAANQLPRALRILAGATFLTGIMLYIAAWYEAITLILFRS